MIAPSHLLSDLRDKGARGGLSPATPPGGVDPSLVTTIDPPALLYSHAVVESESRSLHYAIECGAGGRAGVCESLFIHDDALV